MIRTDSDIRRARNFQTCILQLWNLFRFSNSQFRAFNLPCHGRPAACRRRCRGRRTRRAPMPPHPAMRRQPSYRAQSNSSPSGATSNGPSSTSGTTQWSTRYIDPSVTPTAAGPPRSGLATCRPEPDPGSGRPPAPRLGNCQRRLRGARRVPACGRPRTERIALRYAGRPERAPAGLHASCADRADRRRAEADTDKKDDDDKEWDISHLAPDYTWKKFKEKDRLGSGRAAGQGRLRQRPGAIQHGNSGQDSRGAAKELRGGGQGVLHGHLALARLDDGRRRHVSHGGIVLLLGPLRQGPGLVHQPLESSTTTRATSTRSSPGCSPSAPSGSKLTCSITTGR